MSSPAILSDRLWIPANKVKAKYLEKHFEVVSYDESMCRKCDYRPERPCEACITCPGFGGIIELHKEKEINGERYIGVPSPDVSKVIEWLKLKNITVKNKRKAIPFRSKLKFTGKLFTGKETLHGAATNNQQAVADQFLRYVNKGGGRIKLPPRGGKTVIATNIYCRIKERTLILAAQKDWLKQFVEAAAEFTNLNELRGTPPICMVTTDKSIIEDFKKKGIRVLTVKSIDKAPPECDVVMATYQGLLYNKKRIKKIRRAFSVLIVDEVDQSPAEGFSRVICNLVIRVYCGLSATMKRVDKLSPFLPKIMGPLRAKDDTEVIVPTIELFETGIKFKSYSQWHAFEGAMARDKIRNQMIVDKVLQDLEMDEERHCILLPVRRVSQAKLLVSMINKQAYERGMLPDPMAILFYGGSNRTDVLTKAKTAQVRVVVAVEKIVKRGLSVGPWSIVYVGLVATSNGPNVYQLARRVGTPHPNKPRTIVRYWIDNSPIGLACFKKVWFSDIDGLLKGIKSKNPRYRMDEDHFERAMEIVNHIKSYQPADNPLLPTRYRKSQEKKGVQFGLTRPKAGSVRGFF